MFKCSSKFLVFKNKSEKLFEHYYVHIKMLLFYEYDFSRSEKSFSPNKLSYF